MLAVITESENRNGTEAVNSLVEARYSVSSLASSIHYNCKKHIYLLSRVSRERNNGQRSSVADAHCDRGNVFEEKLFQMHKTVMVDHTHSDDFKKVLYEAEPGTYLYQLKFKIPESFYTDVIGDAAAYRINNFIPDFLQIREDPVTKIRKIMIIDAKSSKEMSKSHQFQVASYAFFLGYLIKDIRNLEIDEIGGVWLPNDTEKPMTFRIDFVVNKIEYIYKNTLVAISNNPHSEWILGKKCNSCQFLRQCKQDAKGTIRSIPYMNEEKATRLKQDPTVDIEDLSDLLENLKIDNSVRSLEENSRGNEYDGYISAYNNKEPQFMGYATVMTAKETDHQVYIYLQMDHFTQKPFIYGINVADSHTGSIVVERYFVTDYAEHVADKLAAYSNFMDQFVRDLSTTFQTMDEKKSRCLIYVYTAQEKAIIQDVLYYLVSSKGEELITLDQDRRNEIVAHAMRCLVVLFQNTQLLGLPGVVQFPDMDDIQRTSSVGRFVIVEELLQQNIALGVSGFYTLFDAVEWLAESFKSGEDTDLSGLDMDEIYTSWKASSSPTTDGELTYHTKHFIVQRFFWLQEIMDCYWSMANKCMDESDSELFPLVCLPFKWPEVQTFRHQILAKLVFFRQLECIKACDDLRMDRIRDLSRIDQGGNSIAAGVGGLVLDLISQESKDRFTTHARFSVRAFTNGFNIQQKLDRLSMDTFRRYVLIPDTRDEIIGLIRFSDLLHMNKGGFQAGYASVGVRCYDVVEKTENEVVLAGASIRNFTSTRFRLYGRHLDYTTLQNIEGLKKIDAEDLVDVVDLIQDPNSWANENVTDHLNIETNKAALKLRDEFSMSPSQKDISSNIFRKRLQIIWGPPGSGKTEFLALFVNWYVQCFVEGNSKSKDLVIGVTAFTRDAIYNLLKRIEKIQKRHGFDTLFRIIYVHSRFNDKKFESDSNMIGAPVDKSMSIINALKKDSLEPNIYVMGATCWSWDKIRNKWKTFKGVDMMILDESTQVLVSEALLAVACLRKPSGKLIVAGDHMQLGPIINNDYSDTTSSVSDPLLFGSIQQCLMRTTENHAIPTREFLLHRGALHDFGPNTLQLKDNWRMNDELNEFFKQVYGPDYSSRYPRIKLHLDLDKAKENTNKLELVKSILNPAQSISLVKLKCTNRSQLSDMVDIEADLVKQLVDVYLDTKVENVPPSQIPINRYLGEPSVMIVTPHNKQRIAIQRKLSYRIPVDTVEKMQGQECDLIIACFSCSSSRAGSHEFIRDFRRWNVALSRARCKVIVLTVDDIIDPSPTEGLLKSFAKTLEPTDGWALLCLLQQWTNKKNSTWNWVIE